MREDVEHSIGYTSVKVIAESNLLKVPNLLNILNWTFQMFLKSSIVSKNSRHIFFLREHSKRENVEDICI
jgi:hypothetical protein